MKRWIIPVIVCLVLAATAAYLAWSLPSPDTPLRASGADSIELMDFPPEFSLSPLPPGWRHKTFWFRNPMQLSLETVGGQHALACRTDAGGSILMRSTDISLIKHSKLSWKWRVDQAINAGFDEATKEGDDHPIRFFLTFKDPDGGKHAAEIIWANTAFSRGDWKIIDGFAHYVADGGIDAALQQWRDQTADLLAIYQRASGRSDGGQLTAIGIMCDSDDTSGKSLAYLAGPVVLAP